jgi:hypothetical protein
MAKVRLQWSGARERWVGGGMADHVAYRWSRAGTRLTRAHRDSVCLVPNQPQNLRLF